MRSVRSRPVTTPGISSPPGGWKWTPLGASSSTSRPDAGNPLGGTPWARANARENAASDAYPAATAAADGDAPAWRSCQAARSSSNRRRSAIGDSPVAAASRRSRWSREKLARRASAEPSAAGSSSESSTRSMRSRRRSAARRLIVFDVLLDAGRGSGHRPVMPGWSEFEAAAPGLAAEVRRRLDAHTHKTLATIRRDGSPRISGTETEFRVGELWIGSMWQARKAEDLQRDPRFALHSGSDEPSSWTGDAKLSGVAEEISDADRVRQLNGGQGPSHLFRLDLREVSTVGLDDSCKQLVIEVWTPGRGVRTKHRS